MKQQKGFIYIGVTILVGLFGAALGLLWGSLTQTDRSPYVAQLDSPVRGLSPQEVDDLRNGRGAGYARMAELNNYPGPRHVLDLTAHLSLSPDQEAQIQTVFEQMQAQAKQIGQEIIQRETHLSAAFAKGTISETDLQAQTDTLAQLYGQLRAIHLQAHLQITPLLLAEQIATYNSLRGYSSTVQEPVGDPQHHMQ